MWSVSDLGFLLIDGERAANEDGEELGEIKCVSEGKVNGELVVSSHKFSTNVND